MNKLIFMIIKLIILCHFFACSNIPFLKKKEIEERSVKYSFSDTTGNYFLLRETGFIDKKNETFVKSQLIPENGDEEKALEKSIVISKMGNLNTKDGQINVLVPKISQYTVWFDGERFFSQMKINSLDKKLEIILVSPEKKWQGKTLVDLPKGDNIVCFFSQLVECIQVTQFLEKSSKMRVGQMNLKIIWDKYPYLQDQLNNLPLEVFSDAVFSYEGVDTDGFLRYELKVAGHSIFYHFNKGMEIIKNFWVSQGISQVKL